MTEKGLTVLTAFIELGYAGSIEYVVIGEDSNVVNDYSSDIKRVCTDNNIKFFFRGDRFSEDVNIRIAVSWRWLIDNTKALIVLHDSPLPRYRGFAPLVNQLINGESEIGVSMLFATSNYDKGPLIDVARAPVSYPINIQEAIQLSLTLYKTLTVRLINRLMLNEVIVATLQDESEATYSLWRDEMDYYINWSKDSNFIERFVDATGYPYKGAKSMLNGKLISVLKVSCFPDVKIHNRDVGKVIFMEEDRPVIVCGSGLVKVHEAIWVEDNQSIFPFKNFRSRFS